MVAAKRKNSKDETPQPMLPLGWEDPEPVPETEELAGEAPVEVEESVVEEPAGTGEPYEEELAMTEDPEGMEEQPEPPAVASIPAPPARQEEDSPSPSAPVGERLRHARELAGLSVARVAEETCLAPAFIENVEQGRYAELLPLAFSRSYVRRLCELYCLPDEGVVRDFVREYEAGRSHKQSSRPVFRVSPDGDESGGKVAYVPNEMDTERRGGFSFSIGNLVAGLMMLAVVALSVTTITLFVLRYLRADDPPPDVVPTVMADPAAGGDALPPAIDLRRFILPEELPLDELPIPQ